MTTSVVFARLLFSGLLFTGKSGAAHIQAGMGQALEIGETTIPKSVDKERRRAVDAAFNTAFQVTGDLCEYLLILTIPLELRYIQFDLFSKPAIRGTVQEFLVFQDRVMHLPELTLSCGGFRSHSSFDGV